MLKIEAVLQPSKLDAVKDALLEAGIEGMTILEARGHGRQKGHTEFYRGREYTVDLLPKVKIELVITEDLKESAIQAIISAARTGRIGDGKIFVSRIDEAIRSIREAVRLDPHFPFFRDNLARALLASGEFAEALEGLRRPHRGGPAGKGGRPLSSE